jgi:hypothetical protein
VYEEFAQFWITREVNKGNDCGLSAAQHLREVSMFCTNLAVAMTIEVQPKVMYQPASLVFTNENDEWATYFDDAKGGAAKRAIRAACPLQCSGNVYSFIHKSVQEALVAMAIQQEVHSAVAGCGLGAQGLVQLCDAVRKGLFPEATDWEEYASREGTGDLGQDLERLVLKPPAEECCAPACKEYIQTQADCRRVAKVLAKQYRAMHQGVLQRVALSEEEAVRDFLVDALLGSLAFTADFEAVAALSRQSTGYGLSVTEENVTELLTASMPRRQGGALVHEAAKEGNVRLLSMLRRLYAEN